MSMASPLDFDFDALTPRLLIDFKEKTGKGLMSLVDDDGNVPLGDMDELLVAGFIWIALRMNGNPDATWDQALDTPLASLSKPAGGDVEPDPTNAS
jgi:hypothetical protein